MPCQSLRTHETKSRATRGDDALASRPRLTVSENIFNYSTWRTEKPKTEQKPFNV